MAMDIGCYPMKTKSLAMQIWLFFAGITLIILISLAILFSITLKHFFANHIFNNIETAQERVIHEPFEIIDSIDKAKYQQDALSVKHIPLSFTNLNIDLRDKIILSISEHNQLTSEFLLQIVNQTENQRATVKRYEAKIDNTKIFYVIHKQAFYTDLGDSYPLFSFMWDTYQEPLVTTLFNRLMLMTIVALVLCLLGAIIFARRLTLPIVSLKENTHRIAERNWDKPITIHRNDEIGDLAMSMEKMRQKLVTYDKNQQSFLQNISHELKTPIMIIRSYVNSLIDNIYPTGDMNSTLAVVDDEAIRLEKRIKDLLYMTKLDYIEKQLTSNYNTIEVGTLIQAIIIKMRTRRPDLEWKLNMQNSTIVGDNEQIIILIENILDNQIRYAKSYIYVSSTSSDNETIITIANDGSSIPDHITNYIFDRFSKGENGQYGMGLAIAKQIIDMHSGNLYCRNKANRVEFIIELKNNM